LLVEEAGGVASDFTDGASLTEPNKAFGCASGLAELVAGMTGIGARAREPKGAPPD
jgi:hypothetical protein